LRPWGLTGIQHLLVVFRKSHWREVTLERTCFYSNPLPTQWLHYIHIFLSFVPFWESLLVRNFGFWQRSLEKLTSMRDLTSKRIGWSTCH
jgi:hypothetical protein